MKIAIPSEQPGGLDSKMCEHFGICPLFTIITLKENDVVSEEILSNPHDGCGNCNQLIEFLSLQKIQYVITQKIGLYPLNIMNRFSISVLMAERKSSVRNALNMYMKNQLSAYPARNTCSGECGC